MALLAQAGILLACTDVTAPLPSRPASSAYVNPGLSLTPAFTIVTARPEPGQAVTVDASASTSPTPMTSFAWDWGDGSPVQQRTSPLGTVHAWAAAGTYQITLTVSDSAGVSGTTQQVVTIGSASAPDFTFGPTPLYAGAEGRFTAQNVGDPAVNAARYLWDFGDNTPIVDGLRASHRFANAGTYRVTFSYQLAGAPAVVLLKTVTVLPEVIPVGAALWLRADQGVTASPAGRVTRWADQSGFATDAMQADTTIAPLLTNGLVNGRPAVRFGISNSGHVFDYLESTSPTVREAFNGNGTIFTVVRPVLGPSMVGTETASLVVGMPGPGSAHAGVAITGAGTPFRATSRWTVGAGTIDQQAATAFTSTGTLAGTLAPTSASSYPGWLVTSTTITSGGGSARVAQRVNGGDLVAQTLPSDVMQVQHAAVRLGAANPRGSGTKWILSGDVAEVLIFARALSDAERAQVEAYLGAKYAVSLTPGVADAAPPASGPALWFRADLGTTIAGSAVTAWADQSGRGYVATQHGITAPSFVTSAMNGKPALHFTASLGQGLRVPGLPTPGTSNYTLLIAHRPFSCNSGINTLWTIADDGVSSGWSASCDGTAGNAAALLLPGVTRVTGGSYTVGMPAVTTIRHADTQLAQWINGAAVLTTTQTSGRALGDTAVIATIGTRTAAAGFYDGDIAEVVYYDRALTDAERIQAERQLESRYGVPLTPSVPPNTATPPVAGYAAWLAADNGVETPGGTDTSVVTWHDQSGNRWHASALTAGSRPVVVARAVNGRPALRFNGTSSCLAMTPSITATPASPVSGATVIAVYAQRATAPSGPVLARSAGEGPLRPGFFASPDGLGIASDSARWTALPRRHGVPYVNGVFGTLIQPNRPAVVSVVLPQVTPGRYSVGIGCDPLQGTLRFLDADIAEVLIYPVALSDGDRQAVERFLSVKYGIGQRTVAGLPVAGARAWFAADHAVDVGATAFSGGRPAVFGWPELTGTAGSRTAGALFQGALPTATDTASWPLAADTAFNGRAAIRFDGVDDLLATAASTTIGQFTMFAAVRASGAPGTLVEHSLAGGSASGRFQLMGSNAASYRVGDGVGLIERGVAPVWMTDNTLRIVTLSSDATPAGTDLRVSGRTATTIDRVNASALGAAAQSAPLFFGGTPGAGAYSRMDLAEVVLYPRVLNASERDAVEQYLASKYNAPLPHTNGAPSAPAFTCLRDAVVQGDSLPCSATGGADPEGRPLAYEFALANTGAGRLIGDGTSAHTLAWGSSGFGRQAASVRTIDGVGNASPFTTTTVMNVPGRPAAWYRSDSVSAGAATWYDLSGNGRHAVSPSGRRATLVAGAMNGKPVLRFAGTHYYDIPALAPVGTAVPLSIYYVQQRSAAQAARGDVASRTLSFWDGNAANKDWSPSPPGYYATSVVDEDTVELAHGAIIGHARPGLGFRPVQNRIGMRAQGNDDGTGNPTATRTLSGDLSEVLIYTRTLSLAEEDSVITYLKARYAANVPPNPVSLICDRLAAGVGQNVTCSAASGGDFEDGTPASYGFSAGGLISQSGSTATYVFDTPGTHVVSAWGYDAQGQRSIASTRLAVNVTANGAPTGVVGGGAALWLRADSGVVLDASSRVQRWIDMTGNARNAIQSVPGARPALSATAVNGKPAITWDTLAARTLIANVPLITTTATTITVFRQRAPQFGMPFAARASGVSVPGAAASPMDFGAFGAPDGRWNAPGSASQFVNGAVSTVNPVNTWIVQEAVWTGGVGSGVYSIPLGTDASQPTRTLDGDIAEVLVFDRNLSPSDRAAVESYLGSKYGITMGVAPAECPGSVCGASMWLRGDRAATLTLDGSSRVATWTDASGSANDATQGTSANRPAITTGAGNGLYNAVRFDSATATSLAFPGNQLVGTTYTVFVAERRQAGGNAPLVGADNDGTANGTLRMGYGTGGSSFDDVRQFNDLSVTVGNFTAPGWTVWTDRLTATGRQLFRDGGSAPAAANSNAAVLAKLTNPTLGKDAPTGTYFTGDIGEIIVYPRTLTDAERLAVTRQLRIKWGAP